MLRVSLLLLVSLVVLLLIQNTKGDTESYQTRVDDRYDRDSSNNRINYPQFQPDVNDNGNNINDPLLSEQLDGSSGDIDFGTIVTTSEGTTTASSRRDSSSSFNVRNSGRETYEFVAFLLWYLFLVLCCIIPTCCAYRRRRMVESRLAAQQASVNRIERQNVFILSALRQQQQDHHHQISSEQQILHRSVVINKLLESTTMTVQEKDIISSEDDKSKTSCSSSPNSPQQQPELTIAPSSSADYYANDAANVNFLLRVGVKDGDDDDDDADNDDDSDNDNNNPSKSNNNSTAHFVPGACAICLGHYELGDEVTWSTEPNCQHAFHKDCIVPWLAKNSEPKCPCCRQNFCQLPPESNSATQLLEPTLSTAAAQLAANFPALLTATPRTLPSSALQITNNATLMLSTSSIVPQTAFVTITTTPPSAAATTSTETSLLPSQGTPVSTDVVVADDGGGDDDDLEQQQQVSEGEDETHEPDSPTQQLQTQEAAIDLECQAAATQEDSHVDRNCEEDDDDDTHNIGSRVAI